MMTLPPRGPWSGNRGGDTLPQGQAPTNGPWSADKEGQAAPLRPVPWTPHPDFADLLFPLAKGKLAADHLLRWRTDAVLEAAIVQALDRWLAGQAPDEDEAVDLCDAVNHAAAEWTKVQEALLGVLVRLGQQKRNVDWPGRAT